MKLDVTSRRVRNQIVRIELRQLHYTDFLQFERTLNLNEMHIVENILQTAYETYDSVEDIMANALRDMRQKLNQIVTTCSAPYLYDIIIE